MSQRILYATGTVFLLLGSYLAGQHTSAPGIFHDPIFNGPITNDPIANGPISHDPRRRAENLRTPRRRLP